MIRTEWAADAEYFAVPHVAVISADAERANLLRCLTSDVQTARLEYVRRRAQIGKANKAGNGMFAKADKSMAFIMFNKARAAMLRAEKALRAAGGEI